MIKQKNRIFRNAHVLVEENTVRCQNHTIRMEAISQVWIGKRREADLSLDLIAAVILLNIAGIHFLNGIFAALTAFASIAVLVLKHVVCDRNVGVHVELCSGDIYSFVSDDEAFTIQAYSLLNEIIMGKKNTVNYSVIFEGNGEIIDHLAIPKEEIVKTYGINDQLVSQLQTLYTAYEQKEDADEQTLLLIGQTTQKIKTNDFSSLKELYGDFIVRGLINECNELGLNVLIGEIKRYIF